MLNPWTAGFRAHAAAIICLTVIAYIGGYATAHLSFMFGLVLTVIVAVPVGFTVMQYLHRDRA